MTNNNPGGTNQFGNYTIQPGYGDVKRQTELLRESPMSGSPLAAQALNAPGGRSAKPVPPLSLPPLLFRLRLVRGRRFIARRHIRRSPRFRGSPRCGGSCLASGYYKPVKGKFVRFDQGVDIQGKPGDHVVAIGLARVDAVKQDPGGFGTAIYYTLLSGPMRGQQIYVGHAQASVKAGQIVQGGDPVATLLRSGLGNAQGLAGWTEIGFAKNGAPEGRSSAKRFWRFVNNQSFRPPTVSAPAVDVSTDASLSPAEQYTVDSTLPPSPDSTVPQMLPPGAGTYVSPSVLWHQIAAQPSVSPDTLMYAQNSAIAT